MRKFLLGFAMFASLGCSGREASQHVGVIKAITFSSLGYSQFTRAVVEFDDGRFISLDRAEGHVFRAGRRNRIELFGEFVQSVKVED